MSGTDQERLRGFIATPSGAKIPVILFLKPMSTRRDYSHVGQIPIPQAWIDEFEEDIRRFYFCCETGEVFTQFHVVDAFEDARGSSKSGRVIVLRDREEDWQG